MTKAEHEKGATDQSQTPRSASARSDDLARRKSWEGRIVTIHHPNQEGSDDTRWRVERHINGSLYEVSRTGSYRIGRQEGPDRRYASHSHHGADWKWWEDRPGSRTAEERVKTADDEQANTPPMTRQEAMDAMDEAVRDGAAQEDEAATLAPPTLDSDSLRVELLGARLESENGLMFVVFKVGPDYYYGPLDKYLPPEFDPLDLIREPKDEARFGSGGDE